MVGDTRNGEHHEQQQEINDGLLHGLGGRAACNDIRGVGVIELEIPGMNPVRAFTSRPQV